MKLCHHVVLKYELFSVLVFVSKWCLIIMNMCLIIPSLLIYEFQVVFLCQSLECSVMCCYIYYIQLATLTPSVV